MKKYLLIILVFALGLGQACKGPEGDQGPPGPAGANGTNGAPGPQGPQGPAGVSDSAQVFDFVASFEAPDTTQGYSFFVPFTGENSLNLEVSYNDLILVYGLAGVAGTEEDPIPFWSPLPQRYETPQGPFTYNYAFSTVGMLLFIETQLDIANAPGITDDQLFRMVVIPGKELAGRTSGKPLTKADLSKYPVDLNDYNAVVKYFRINDQNVKKFTFKK